MRAGLAHGNQPLRWPGEAVRREDEEGDGVQAAAVDQHGGALAGHEVEADAQQGETLGGQVGVLAGDGVNNPVVLFDKLEQVGRIEEAAPAW